jgi:hypothetical protein
MRSLPVVAQEMFWSNQVRASDYMARWIEAKERVKVLENQSRNDPGSTKHT